MMRCGEPMEADGRTYACRASHGHDHPHTICGDREHRHGSTPCTVFGDPADGTPMLDAVRADLATVDLKTVPGGQTYRMTALWLAQVIDKRGGDEGPSTTAKLAEQLAKVMKPLTEKAGTGGDPFNEWADDISTPDAG